MKRQQLLLGHPTLLLIGRPHEVLGEALQDKLPGITFYLLATAICLRKPQTVDINQIRYLNLLIP